MHAKGVFNPFSEGYRNDFIIRRQYAAHLIQRAEIADIVGAYDNVSVIDGFELVPHNEAFFSDKRLHPNDVGERYIADGIIKYYLDPRNFLKNDVSVFQFLEMSYSNGSQNIEGVKGILKNTFMDKTIYINGIGDISYAEIIMKAAEESKMSPYSIAIKILQDTKNTTDNMVNLITSTPMVKEVNEKIKSEQMESVSEYNKELEQQLNKNN